MPAVPRVFAYGSLLAEDLSPPAQPFVLGGWRRSWGCAMDNAAAVNDDKHWVDRVTGERPAVAVAYAAIEVDPRGRVAGALFDADALGGLAALDARERHYVRVALGDDTWTYVARASAAARALGPVVLARAYTARVVAGLQRHGHARRLPAPAGPVEDLVRAP